MRASRAVSTAVLVLALAPAAGRAEKKKPGLFDIETWKAPVTREREAAQTLAPGQIDVTPFGERRAEPIAVRLRVYADPDYRAGVLHWQTKFRTQVDRLNRIVGPLFSVRFEIESLRTWDRSHMGIALEKMLDELHALDSAREVDLVIGLVTPFHGVATNVHHIGMAPLSSRHFVLRGMDDAEEGKALDRELSMLAPGERDKLYADRKAHKELVIFLHEWGHTLGAMHAEDASLLMNPTYDPKQAAFTEFQKRLVELVVAQRAADRTKPFPETSELLTLVRAAPREEGSAADRRDLVAYLSARGLGSAPTGGQPSAPGQPTAAASGDAASLVRLAATAASEGAYTNAEAALARAGKAAPPQMLADLDAARSRVALPREAAKLGIAPQDEPRYVAAFELAHRAIESRNHEAAQRRVAELAAAFPDSAGRDVAACELALSLKRFADAEKSCLAALAKDPNALLAHLALGRLGARARRYPDAEKHYRRALLLAPSDPDAWSELGHLYRATGSETQRDRLAREHEALFSNPLPP